MKKNIYALIDCDNFYVSCERIFRPDLRNRPVAVLSNNDGCIISRSNEVKALGIQMGTPYFKISGLIKENNIQIFSSNYSLYADISNRINRVLEEFTPNIEIYSIDEAFIILSIPKDKCTSYCKEIRERILQGIGVPVTIGIAYTKTLTKVASKIAKKQKKYNGVLSLLNRKENDKYLEIVEVEDIWGVGRQYSKWLHSIGIHTAKDLKYCDRNRIRSKMTVQGYRTVLELNSVECISLDQIPSIKKNIVSSKAFGKVTKSLDEIKKSLAIDVARAGEKLRKQNCVTGMLSVFLTTDPFKPHHYSKSIGIKLPFPVSDTATLTKYAIECLEKIFIKSFEYKKTGVLFTDIRPVDNVQLDLINPYFIPHHEKTDKIMRAIDSINREWGRDTVRSASMGIDNELKMKQERKSPRYTTRWDELLVAKI
jgi:DNA polymerase V